MQPLSGQGEFSLCMTQDPCIRLQSARARAFLVQPKRDRLPERLPILP